MKGLACPMLGVEVAHSSWGLMVYPQNHSATVWLVWPQNQQGAGADVMAKSRSKARSSRLFMRQK